MAERTPARSFLAAQRDEHRHPIETLLLPVIARCYPFIDSHDPDRARVHAAACRVFARGRLEALAGLVPGAPAEAARFGRAAGGRGVLAMLHAFDNQLQLDYVAGQQVFSREVQVTERNPELDTFAANVAALRDAVQLADSKIRAAAGIAPSDPGWSTWLSLQPGLPDSLAELIALRTQAVQSLSFRRSFPPTATVQLPAFERFAVPEVRQRYRGHAAREVVVLAEGMSVAETVRHELGELTYLRRGRTPNAAEVNDWRDPVVVSNEIRTALDQATDAALERLLARIVAARLADHLTEGRQHGWSDQQVQEEANALQFWFGLTTGDPAQAAAAEPARDLATVLDSQVGEGGWARRLFTLMPPVPALEELVEVLTFEGKRCEDGTTSPWFSADLRHLIVRDPPREARVVDLVSGATVTGAEAQRITAAATGIRGLGDAVTWLDTAPTADSLGVRWSNDFWASIQRQIGAFAFRPVYYRDERGIEHFSNQLQEFEVVVEAPRGRDDRPTWRPVVRVAVPHPFHDGGLLASGQVAWTLSQARTLRCSRNNCTHSGIACWDWRGEPSIELWHLPSGDRIWQATSCKQVVILAHLGRVISFHPDPKQPDDRHVVRIWGIPEAK
ncbi:MAG: hypothetical protein K8J09_08205 [Planctomycetes bacterium]|nr:hypothetical protein [Planctomycetota bacterium]MCC7395493.1 hypothetical protein [Planctomycetota bacterium]